MLRQRNVGIHLKSSAELAIMREAGRIVARCHEAMREAIKPGVNTLVLDQITENIIRQHNAIPAFKNYSTQHNARPFPASITVCIDDELVHGIPSASRILQEGQIVSLDVGVIYKGYVGDAAFSMGVGHISKPAQRLLDVTEKSLYEGIHASVVGNTTRDVARTVQRFVEKQGYTVAQEYTGHGVGRKMHEEPQVPNWWPEERRRGWRPVHLQPGMTYALEPMVIAGPNKLRTLEDDWTVVTEDGSLCAHFEHTIAVTNGEPLILTVL